MQILNAIVHEVKKEEDSAAVEVIFRHDENEIDSHAIDLSKQLTGLFKKTGLNSGGFIQPEEDEQPPQFVNLLNIYLDQLSFTDFVKFTQSATKEFQKQLFKATAAKGGYLWFNHYIHNDEHFLSVVLLRKKAGLALSENLTLDQIEQLDLDKLHMASRINLSRWIAGSSNRYISFRIGKNAKDVTGYFAKFIGCEEFTRAKIDTQNLVAVTKEYCQTNNFDDVASENIKQFVFDRCSEWLANDEAILLENISTALDACFQPENKGTFLEISQNEPYSLNNEMSVEKASLRSLTRYNGKNKDLSISFSSDLLNVSVFYDSKNKALKITDLPQSLLAQLPS